MINAMNMLPSAVDIRCWNHVLQDFQRWLLENGANKAESAVYKDDIRQILCAKSEEDSLKTFDAHSRKWDPKVTKIQSLARWAIEPVTKFDPYSGVIQNQSESLNKLMKSIQKWKECLIDVIVLSFLRLQQYYLKEISRGRAGIWNYTLKTEHVSARIDLSEIAQLEVCDPDKIVESIRDNKFITERHGAYDNMSRVDIGLSRAEEIIANEMISFSPKMHTVLSQF